MSGLQVFYAEGGRYVSDAYSRASVGDIAFGGELNHTKLYGNQRIYGETSPFMFVSETVSNSEGKLDSQTSVKVERQNIDGLTLIFDPAGGTHPKEVNVVLMSQTAPNFENKLLTESYSHDMSGRISDDGLVRGMRLDAATGEMIADGAYMSSGMMTGVQYDTVIRTRGIDWLSGDQTKTGFCAYNQRWSGVRVQPVFKVFTSVAELLAGDSNIGKIEIYDNGEAKITLGFDRHSNNIAFCVPLSDAETIVTLNEEVTYGDDMTATPTKYVSASIEVVVNNPLCTMDIAANDVTSIEVAMTDVNAPYVHHKLTTMYSGTMTMYDADGIISCDIIEQADILSETMPTNTCDVVMIDPAGIRYNPSVRQRIEVYRDGDLRGVFFIDDIKKTGTNRYAIASHGITGELEQYSFIGDVYKDKDTKRLIAEIFDAAGIYFEIDEEIPITTLSGWVPMTDCKTALRTVLFAAGLTLDVSRTPHPRVRHIDVSNTTAEREITDTLAGESVTEERQVSRIEMKTRIYINPDDDAEYDTTPKYYSHKEYGKGYKPIYLYTDQPSVIKRSSSLNAAMQGSTANCILWDGTRYYQYSDGQGGTYNSNNWAVQLYPYAVRELSAAAYIQGASGAVIKYDNTMMSQYNGGDIASRCLWWYRRGQILNAGIVGDVRIGENVSVEISDGAAFVGTVTQVRYSPVGSRMIQEVVLRGTDHGSYARRL